MNITELKQSQDPKQKKSVQKNDQAQPQKKQSKTPKTKNSSEVNKNTSSQQVKECKSNQLTSRKGKENINSKTTLNNPKSENNIKSETNFSSQNSNEQNTIKQLKRQIEQRDLIIDALKQQNIGLKRKVLTMSKSKKDISQIHPHEQSHMNYGMRDQLSVAKRLQETNKILIDRIKELDSIKYEQALLLQQKTESQKILKQKYFQLKKTLKSNLKKNNDLKKENDLVKSIKFNVNQTQNIDYNQLAQALAIISQNQEVREQLPKQERDDQSRGTFYTQRSSALGDYAPEYRINQKSIQKHELEGQRSKQNLSNHVQFNEQNNYYNQSMQDIQQNSSRQLINNDSQRNLIKNNPQINNQNQSKKLKQNK